VKPTWTEVPFDPKLGYPGQKDLLYECIGCGEKIPSLPSDSTRCSCGNVRIDVDAGRMSVSDPARIRLLKRITPAT
jgi:hypothetical protein